MQGSGSSDPCRACGGREFGSNFPVREMMLGTGERFDYHECGACHTLQIVRPPPDLGRYYPAGDYVAFTPRSRGSPVAPILRWRDRASLRAAGPDRAVMGWFGLIEPGLDAVRRLSIPRTAAVLDVGCGAGRLLLALAENGFTDLAGADAYSQPELPPTVRFVRGDLEPLGGKQFRLILFNHSLEHLANPDELLRAAAGRLDPEGRILVRLPIAARAWEEYRANWFQLDAPRHLFVPTLGGMERLARRSGLTILWSYFDSDETQFLLSERYAQGKPLGDLHYPRRSDLLRRVASPRVRRLRALAREANRIGRGDQAVLALAPAAATG